MATVFIAGAKVKISNPGVLCIANNLIKYSVESSEFVTMFTRCYVLGMPNTSGLKKENTRYKYIVGKCSVQFYLSRKAAREKRYFLQTVYGYSLMFPREISRQYRPKLIKCADVSFDIYRRACFLATVSVGGWV